MPEVTPSRSPLARRPRPASGRWRPRRAGVLAVVAALLGALAVSVVTATPAAAAPSPSTGQTSASAKSPHPTRPLCAAPAAKGALRCFALGRTDVRPHVGASPAVTPDGYGPADLHAAYALPSTGAAGTVVAIVDAFDNPDAEADLAVYRAQYGLPACTTANGCFRKVNQRGEASGYPAPDPGWAGEIALDVDMVSAVCPACHILLVEADDNFTDNLAAGVQTAVDLGAQFVSNSYGGTEDASETQFDSTYSQPGVVVTASTGDDGYGTSYPATSPGVTAVGGTSLDRAQGTGRGWTESAWSGAGSGCSTVEPKPAFQTDDGCDHRAVADVSAVADPNTGVAVYNNYSDSGWSVYGGTSASAPIIASVYALAGSPAAGTSPNAYPYAAPAGSLNDVTTGDNGSCSPDYLCTARPGYDGPTGLGTPHGLAAFTTGPHGTVQGTVTTSGGRPVQGAQVSVGDYTATTGQNGHWSLVVPVGTYHLSFAAYGYRTADGGTITVRRDRTLTRDVELAKSATSTVSGRVTDGSGHHWGLYSAITVSGMPGGPVWTDPFTGAFSVDLPRGVAYTLHVAPQLPGYDPVDTTVRVAGAAVTKDIAVKVSVAGCNAPGYTTQLTGSTEHFDNGRKPAGWQVTGNRSQGVWTFTDNHPRGNLTGGSGGFAIIDSDDLGTGLSQDTSLVSPTYDLSHATSPVLDLHTYYKPYQHSTGDIDLSVDGGATWSTLVEYTSTTVEGPVEVPLTAAAGRSQVQVRFHYRGSFDYFWEVDDVFVGQKTCAVLPGGLVSGFVTDRNTRAPLNGVTVTSKPQPADSGTSRATPDDPSIPDGWYWLFSSSIGSTQFRAELGAYTAITNTVSVSPDAVTRKDFSLPAGRLEGGGGDVQVTQTLGGSATATVTYRNTGDDTVHVQVSDVDGGSQIQGRPASAAYAGVPGAPVQRVPGAYGTRRLAGAAAKAAAGPAGATEPHADPWTPIADYPTPISNNVAATLDGKVYSFGGFDGSEDVADGYVYDPAAQTWSATAPMSETREAAAAAMVDGRLVVTGGWGPDGAPTGVTEAYDPASDSWTALATNPHPYAAAAWGVVDGQLVVVGGCSANACGSSDVMVYDPAADSWSAGPAYPEATSWESCGAVGGALYCAGGTTDSGTSTATYALSGGAWSARADAPADVWGAGFAAVGDRLVISGGVVDDSSTVTNEGWAYDPSADAWTSLPASDNALYRMGSACGFYKIGGSASNADPVHAESEVLPGLDACSGGADATWLRENPSSFDLAPGASRRVTLTLDSSHLDQPGTYSATVTADAASPYPDPAATTVTFVVQAPSSWGKLTGTVRGRACGGGAATPIAGATVQLGSWSGAYTLTTDADGRYVLWLDRRHNPVQVIVAKDGWQPQTGTVTVEAGAVVTTDYLLKPAHC